MASGQSTVMSASMNMAITIFGFVLSALFILVICCRLLCSRFRHGSSREMIRTGGRRSMGSSSIERSLNGLEPSVVSFFPTIKYNQHIFVSSEDNVCTICLGDYSEKEVLRLLPRCGHGFHVSCIDAWLRQHSTCPICRISLRVFSESRQMSGPLINHSAKVRFVPGALPDSMFELPSNVQNVQAGLHPVKERLEWPIVINKDERDLGKAESSSSGHQETVGLGESDTSVDMQHLFSPKSQLAGGKHSSVATEASLASEDSKRFLLCKTSTMDDLFMEEGGDQSFYTIEGSEPACPPVLSHEAVGGTPTNRAL